jgi:hypothetical protein
MKSPASAGLFCLILPLIVIPAKAGGFTTDECPVIQRP